MPKSKEQKKQILESIKDKLAKSKSVVFSSDKGLDVKTVEALRREMRDSGAEYLVTKKTLLKMATKDFDGDNDVDEVSGSVGVTMSYEDEITGAKVLNKYAKANEALELNGGILENKLILSAMVKRLATLPSKEELLAKLVGSINAPLSGLVGVLSGNTRNLVGVLNAIKEKKQ